MRQPAVTDSGRERNAPKTPKGTKESNIILKERNHFDVGVKV